MFQTAPFTQKADGIAIAVESTDIDIRLAATDAMSTPAPRQPRINQRAEIFVPFLAGKPKLMERVENGARHLKCAPNPVRFPIVLLHLNLLHVAGVVSDHHIKKFR